MFLGVLLNTVFLNIFYNQFNLELRIHSIQVVVIISFVLTWNVHIKKAECKTQQPLYNTVVGSKAETVLVKQPCYIQTKMYRLCRKMTINGHFSI